MPRKKKSRKVGQIGVPKAIDGKRPVRTEPKKPKKQTGKAPGSRHSMGQQEQKQQSVARKDPRIGSKKPVELVVKKDQPAKSKPRKFFSPADELADIENDNRLAQLLDKADEGNTLSKEQQDYVDTRLARHKILCDLLGIAPEEEDNNDDSDPFGQLDSSDLDAFKDGF